MKKPLALVLCGLLIGAGSAWSFQGAAKRSHFVDEVHGYSLDAPRFPDDGSEKVVTTVSFRGPPTHGGVSNVNVQVQRIATTRANFRKLTEEQFEKLAIKVLATKESTVSGLDAIEIDYQGRIGGALLPETRHLALALIDRERVILVTCTTIPEEFPRVEAEFRACLASVRLNRTNP